MRITDTTAHGYTLIEVMSTAMIAGLMLASAMPHFDSRRLGILNAQRILIANLRTARSNAISKSMHYQVTFSTQSQLQVAAMDETPAGSGVWQADTTKAQSIKLPTGTSVDSSLVGTSVEFNSRGIAVNVAATLQVNAHDTYGQMKSLQVWPSGQINEL